MTLYLYGLKNVLSGIFERPVAEICDEKEYPEYLSQSLALADVDTLNRYKEYDVFCLGKLDSKTGHITSNVDFICSLKGLCETYIAAKAAKEEKHDEQGSQQA